MKTLINACLMTAMCLLIQGCGQNTEEVTARVKDELNPEEKRFLEAATPFINAVAARDYEQAFHLLSPQARARVSINQFVPAQDDAKYVRNEKNALTNIKLAEFTHYMKLVEEEFGTPAMAKDFHVFSLDKNVLSGQGEKLDVLFAIGAMPESVPAQIRRASLRGQIGVALSPTQLKQAAEAYGMSPTELQSSSDFDPYLNLKLVLVEDPDGQTRVGYFEFLPPSILD